MALAKSHQGNEPGILPRVARREAQAMRECIDAFGGLVWSIARRFVKPDSETEDVVQEVFTELWQKAGRFDSSRASEATFVGLIARGRSIDWLRKRSRRPMLEPIADGFDVAEADSNRNPSSRIGAEEIQAALKNLPSDTRELFLLHFEQGKTHPEIASETGLPLGTVKTKLRRGLVELRSAMRQERTASA